MTTSLGRIKAELAEVTPGRLSQLIELINKNVNPPEAVAESEAYIRAMYVVSDEVNSFGGRFPPDELEHLAELLVDSPVLVGHRKDKLPVARTFHAEIVQRGQRDWVKSYFYWLRSTRGAENLKENIDGGIYKECSIGFTYMLPECSICGKDIRTCRHQPFESYDGSGSRQPCHFNYRQIERVLETSLVYRGAVPGTMVSKDLKVPEDRPKVALAKACPIADPMELPPGRKYLVMPNYEGISVTASCRDGKLALQDKDGNEILSIADSEIRAVPEIVNRFGLLVGYRGKERCGVDLLRRYLDRKTGPVTRVELKLLPGAEEDDAVELVGKTFSVRAIRHVLATPAELDNRARRLMTRDGVLVFGETSLPPAHAGYIYRPDRTAVGSAGGWGIYQSPGSSRAVLLVCDEDKKHQFIINQFSLLRLEKGSRFLADRCGDMQESTPDGLRCLASGKVIALQAKDDGFVAHLNGALSGLLVMQPAKINGHSRWLVYRTRKQQRDQKQEGTDQ